MTDGETRCSTPTQHTKGTHHNGKGGRKRKNRVSRGFPHINVALLGNIIVGEESLKTCMQVAVAIQEGTKRVRWCGGNVN